MDMLDLYRFLKWQSFTHGPELSQSIKTRNTEEGVEITGIRLAHTVKNEVGDRFKATAEGKAYWQYLATVHANESLTYELYWYVWQPTEEPKEFLKSLGLRWDTEELKEGSTPEAGKLRFYRNGKLVGELSWLLISPPPTHA